jgi:hypothetical protein
MISSPASTKDTLKKILELAAIAKVNAALIKELENEANLNKYCTENPGFAEMITAISVPDAKANVKELEKYRGVLKWYLEVERGQSIPPSKYARFNIFGLPLYDLQLVLDSKGKQEYFWQTRRALPESKDGAKVVAAKADAVKSAKAKILQFAQIANVNPTLIATLGNEKELGKFADDYPRQFIMIKEADVARAKEVVQGLSNLRKAVLRRKLETEIKDTVFPTNKFSQFHLFGFSSYELNSLLSTYEDSVAFKNANPTVEKAPSHTSAYDNARKRKDSSTGELVASKTKIVELDSDSDEKLEKKKVEKKVEKKEVKAKKPKSMELDFHPKFDSDNDEKQEDKKEEEQKKPMRKSSTGRSPKR